jgi:hypothetical protein
MNQVATIEASTAHAPAMGGINISTLLMDPALLQQLDALASRMASGKATVPDHLRGSVGDCYAIVLQAIQWRMNPYAVAQKTYLISGKLGYEAQLVNAVITSLAPTQDRLHFEWYGDWPKILGKVKVMQRDGKTYRNSDWKPEDEAGLGVRTWATLKGESEPRVLELLLTQALTRNSTLWADDPRQQLAYLATKRWARLYCPDVILGVYTPDEFDQVSPERDITPQPEQRPTTSRTAVVREKLRPTNPEPSEPVTSPVIEGVAETLGDAQSDVADEGTECERLIEQIMESRSPSELKAIGEQITVWLSGGEDRKPYRARLMATYSAQRATLKQNEEHQDEVRIVAEDEI